jgi:hypothetical protein
MNDDPTPVAEEAFIRECFMRGCQNDAVFLIECEIDGCAFLCADHCLRVQVHDEELKRIGTYHLEHGHKFFSLVPV